MKQEKEKNTFREFFRDSKKLSRNSFIVMLCGPAFLFLSGLIYDLSPFPWDNPVILVFRSVLTWIGVLLPAVGAMFAIISVVICWRAKKNCHAFSIITLIMCNPIFYLFYFVLGPLMTGPVIGLLGAM